MAVFDAQLLNAQLSGKIVFRVLQGGVEQILSLGLLFRFGARGLLEQTLRAVEKVVVIVVIIAVAGVGKIVSRRHGAVLFW